MQVVSLIPVNTEVKTRLNRPFGNGETLVYASIPYRNWIFLGHVRHRGEWGYTQKIKRIVRTSTE